MNEGLTLGEMSVKHHPNQTRHKVMVAVVYSVQRFPPSSAVGNIWPFRLVLWSYDWYYHLLMQ